VTHQYDKIDSERNAPKTAAPVPVRSKSAAKAPSAPSASTSAASTSATSASAASAKKALDEKQDSAKVSGDCATVLLRYRYMCICVYLYMCICAYLTLPRPSALPAVLHPLSRSPALSLNLSMTYDIWHTTYTHIHTGSCEAAAARRAVGHRVRLQNLEVRGGDEAEAELRLSFRLHPILNYYLCPCSLLSLL
jgi:hypothetical protein